MNQLSGGELDDDDSDEELSEYQRERMRRIAENQAHLASIGLLDAALHPPKKTISKNNRKTGGKNKRPRKRRGKRDDDSDFDIQSCSDVEDSSDASSSSEDDDEDMEWNAAPPPVPTLTLLQRRKNELVQKKMEQISEQKIAGKNTIASSCNTIPQGGFTVSLPNNGTATTLNKGKGKGKGKAIAKAKRAPKHTPEQRTLDLKIHRSTLLILVARLSLQNQLCDDSRVAGAALSILPSARTLLQGANPPAKFSQPLYPLQARLDKYLLL